eukprot:COSAG03_NODE_25119_length_267_cov_1.815476_1_plen_55_part_10
MGRCEGVPIQALGIALLRGVREQVPSRKAWGCGVPGLVPPIVAESWGGTSSESAD